MFATTFLGHQGWMFRSESACVLLDPLLADDFGHGQALGYSVYPPRVVRWPDFPAVDAVVLSHEHDDHLDIPSLARLERSIPLHLSARSSAAAHTVLKEMGFKVLPLVPGHALRVRELEVHPLHADHEALDGGDEWDVVPLLVRHTAGHGSFFTAVDLTVTSRLLEEARQHEPRPGLMGWTNNVVDRSFMTDFQPALSGATRAFADGLKRAGSAVARLWGEPGAFLICGGGFAFGGDRSYLNHELFCVDAEQAAGLAAAEQAGRCFSTRPGQTFHLRDNALLRVDDGTPFLETAPRERWPSRATELGRPRPDYEPATGRRDMPPADVQRLLSGLQELADALVGSRLFRSLYCLSEADFPGRRCTFALVLRHGQHAGVFEYNPSACRFERSQLASPRQAYLAGLECWATDFLAVLSGDLAPIAISFGRAALWNAAPQRLDFCLLTELYRISHPLRRPAAFLRSYRKAWDEQRDRVPVVRGPHGG